MRFVCILITTLFTGLSFLEFLAPGLAVFRFVNVLSVLSFFGTIYTFVPTHIFTTYEIEPNGHPEENEVELRTVESSGKNGSTMKY